MSSTPGWDRVKAVFQEVLERPPEERGARLRELCGPDGVLSAMGSLCAGERARFMTSLRAKQDEARTLLETNKFAKKHRVTVGLHNHANWSLNELGVATFGRRPTGRDVAFAVPARCGRTSSDRSPR